MVCDLVALEAKQDKGASSDGLGQRSAPLAMIRVNRKAWGQSKWKYSLLLQWTPNLSLDYLVGVKVAYKKGQVPTVRQQTTCGVFDIHTHKKLASDIERRAWWNLKDLDFYHLFHLALRWYYRLFLLPFILSSLHSPSVRSATTSRSNSRTPPKQTFLCIPIQSYIHR